MASGLVVLGDKTAFNAIDKVEHTVNAFVIDESIEWVRILENPGVVQKINSMKLKSRELAVKQLNWNNKSINV